MKFEHEKKVFVSSQEVLKKELNRNFVWRIIIIREHNTHKLCDAIFETVASHPNNKKEERRIPSFIDIHAAKMDGCHTHFILAFVPFILFLFFKQNKTCFVCWYAIPGQYTHRFWNVSLL